MSSQPLFYKNITPLSNDKHADWTVEPVNNYKHASETNSIYIAAIEFLKVANEYPIVFGTGENGSTFPVALLGLKKNENLMVNKKGEWLGRYIPAYIRRYPFILAMDQNEGNTNFTVCIDSTCPGFKKKGKGKKLFDDDGKPSPLLEGTINFLKEYQNHIQLTNSFCKNVNELDLLEPMKAEIKKSDGTEFSLAGFKGINRERLKALDADKLINLVKTDQMELIYAHLTSLGNIDALISKI